MQQLTSFMPDQFLICFSTWAPISPPRGRQERAAESRDPLLGSSLFFVVSLTQLPSCSFSFTAKLFYLTSVSIICKGGSRVRSWSCLYNPSSLLLCFSSTGIHFIPLILLPRITITIIPYAIVIFIKNHRVIWAERHVWKSSNPTPCSKQGLPWFGMCQRHMNRLYQKG